AHGRRHHPRGTPAAPARGRSRAAHARGHRGEIPRQLRLRRMGRRPRLALAGVGPKIRRAAGGPFGFQGVTMASGARELEGRVALVTGASRNIGRATALALADGGAAVIVNARVSIDEANAVAREIGAKGGKAVALVADVTDERAVNAMVAQGLARFGRLDILVNNAAVRGVSDIDAIDAAEFRRISGIILDGAFICVKAALAALRASGQGAIVNIGGMSGHTGAKGRPHVVAAKL